MFLPLPILIVLACKVPLPITAPAHFEGAEILVDGDVVGKFDYEQKMQYITAIPKVPRKDVYQLEIRKTGQSVRGEVKCPKDRDCYVDISCGETTHDCRIQIEGENAGE